MENKTFTINRKFKTQLTTAILSSPIVYIPHFNYAYVDKALEEICDVGALGFTTNSIAEFTEDGALLSFNDKRVDDDWNKEISGLLNVLINNDPDEDEILNDKVIFLIKNFFTLYKEFLYSFQ